MALLQAAGCSTHLHYCWAMTFKYSMAETSGVWQLCFICVVYRGSEKLHMYCTVLHCTVLCCTVLYCTVLYCTVLYCTVLYCTVLYCTVLYCTVLYCTVLYCTVLYCTVLYCTVLYCTVLYCTVQQCSTKIKIFARPSGNLHFTFPCSKLFWN